MTWRVVSVMSMASSQGVDDVDAWRWQLAPSRTCFADMHKELVGDEDDVWQVMWSLGLSPQASHSVPRHQQNFFPSGAEQNA
eukprot:2912187-Amphidinium_carterae.1